MSVSIGKDYPFRQQILEEVHARPVEMVPAAIARAPSRVCRAARSRRRCRGARALLRLVRAGRDSCAPRNKDVRQHSFTAGTRQVTWEFHTEFVTVTWTAAPDDSDSAPEGIGLELIDGPQLLGAMRIDLVEDTRLPDALLPGFNPHSLCVIGVEGGAGQLATDFVPDAERFTRFEFAAGGLPPLRRAILVRRILEIETYRTMALIGLPLARQHASELGSIETELTEQGQLARRSDRDPPGPDGARGAARADGPGRPALRTADLPLRRLSGLWRTSCRPGWARSASARHRSARRCRATSSTGSTRR